MIFPSVSEATAVSSKSQYKRQLTQDDDSSVRRVISQYVDENPESSEPEYGVKDKEAEPAEQPEKEEPLLELTDDSEQLPMESLDELKRLSEKAKKP